MIAFPGRVRPRNAHASALAVVNISALARSTGVSCRALRYYEEIGLLEPVRTRSGGRLYSASQCEIAAAIVHLRNLDISIAEIRSLLDTSCSEHDRSQALQAALELRASQLARQLDRVRDALTGWGGVTRKVIPMAQDRPVSRAEPITLAG